MNCAICNQPIVDYYVDVYKVSADLAPHPAHWPSCPVTKTAKAYSDAVAELARRGLLETLIDLKPEEGCVLGTPDRHRMACFHCGRWDGHYAECPAINSQRKAK